MTTTLTKQVITERLAEKFDLSQREVRPLVDEVVDLLFKSLSAGERVELRGLGSFKLAKAVRTEPWYCPGNGKLYPPYSGRYVKFLMAKQLKRALNQKEKP